MPEARTECYHCARQNRRIKLERRRREAEKGEERDGFKCLIAKSPTKCHPANRVKALDFFFCFLFRRTHVLQPETSASAFSQLPSSAIHVDPINDPWPQFTKEARKESQKIIVQQTAIVYQERRNSARFFERQEDRRYSDCVIFMGS